LKLIPENSPWPRLLVFPLLAVTITGLSIARMNPDLAFKLAYCPLRDTTGIPCLTCGGTHSIVSLMHGRLLEALAANPMVALGVIGFGLWSLWALITTFKPDFRRSFEFSRHEKRTARILTALFIFGTWAWEFWQFRG